MKKPGIEDLGLSIAYFGTLARLRSGPGLGAMTRSVGVSRLATAKARALGLVPWQCHPTGWKPVPQACLSCHGCHGRRVDAGGWIL